MIEFRNKKRIEVCFSPALFEYQKNKEDIVVVVDILRATSSICAAFESGVDKIIPVGSGDLAKEYKEKGYIVASEKDGIKLDFADIGNSPSDFAPEIVKGKEIVYSTTNGTKTIMLASDCHAVVIGAFSNLSALIKWLMSQEREVMILCAGWKNRFNIEDTVFAGAVTDALLQDSNYYTVCDSAKASQSLWLQNRNSLYEYLQTTAQKQRLMKNGLDFCIEFCATIDTTKKNPFFRK
jgi:2-phosphosulfolactate phosphatase